MNNKLFWSILLFFLAIMSLTTCKTEIDLKLKNVERNLVLNGVLSPDSVFTVHLQWTSPLGTPPAQQDTAWEGTNQIWQSLVLVKDQQGNLIDTACACLSDSMGHESSDACDQIERCASFSLFNQKVKFNTTYQIEVLRNDYPKLSATCHTPNDFSINLNIQDTVTTTFGGNKVYDLKINIADNPNEQNYYIIEAQGREPIDSLYELYQAIGLYCLDPSCENTDIARQEDQYQRIFLSDTEFDGLNYQFSLKVSQYFMEFAEPDTQLFLDIKISSVSQDLYEYYKDFEQHERSYGSDIFAQPVDMHSNVSNELGILGASVHKTLSFRVK